MPKISAGLLLYKIEQRHPYMMLVHPAGPYYEGKHLGTWGIPKGWIEEGEELLETAKREFEEETGIKPHGPYWSLGSIRYSKPKTVHAWAFQGEWDEKEGITSNTFEMEWPPKSGNMQTFPEIDEGMWFHPLHMRRHIHPAQWPLILRLVEKLEIEGLIDAISLPETL